MDMDAIFIDSSEFFEFNISDYNYTYLDEMEYYNCDQVSSMAFDAIFIPVLYTVAVVVGLLGNGLVLVFLWQKRQSWSVTDTFVLHLSVVDILLLLTMPLWAVEAVIGWIFGTVLCKLTGALFRVNFFCGMFLLACISLERYLSVVHAVKMYPRRRPWGIKISCMVVWFFSLLLSIPDWIFLQAAKESRRSKTECVPWYPSYEWRLACRFLYHVLGFIIPAAVMLYCYSCIFLRLCRGSQRGAVKLQDRQLILVLVVVFFICWAPYNIVLMVDTNFQNQSSSISSCYTSTALDIALTATSTLGYLHCCMNPLLYTIVWGKFRDNVLDMARRGRAG